MNAKDRVKCLYLPFIKRVLMYNLKNYDSTEM